MSFKKINKTTMLACLIKIAHRISEFKNPKDSLSDQFLLAILISLLCLFLVPKRSGSQN